MSETKDGGQNPVPDYQSPQGDDLMMYPMGTAGAVVGAGVGVLVMYLGMRAGLYAEPVIGVAAGWVAGMFARRRSWVVGVIAGVVALFTGVWAEWKLVAPMIADDSFWYFLTHVHELSRIKLVFHGIGGVAAVWLGARR